ncbi:MAG: DUF1049 domain-containing protein [Peptococcaceae bacterium]|nr:DUF1049 domain-containing protein [Peptococcaceae bacterium]
MFVLMISIILALIIVVFAVQNAAIVPVQFLFWSTDLPLVLVIFCSVFAGALLMFSFALWREFKKQIGKRGKSINGKKASVNGPIDVTDCKTSSSQNSAEIPPVEEKK